MGTKKFSHPDFSRPLTLFIEKDGTLTYGDQRRATPGLPVFTVNTEEEAKELQVRFCRRRYDGTYGWTDFGGELEDLEKARLIMSQHYATKQKEAR